MAERLRPRTSIPEVPGSIYCLEIAPLGKALCFHCLVFLSSVCVIGESRP